MNIPRFSSTITTIRKYKVSISIILQNMNQLINQYSKEEAKTILDGAIIRTESIKATRVPTKTSFLLVEFSIKLKTIFSNFLNIIYLPHYDDLVF